MKSATRLVLARLSIPACAMLALTACVSAPPIVATSGACPELIPQGWRVAVPGAPLPDGNAAGDWVQFGDAQTGQLDKANDRTLGTIEIVERCEELNRKAIKDASKPWWRLW